MLPFDDILNVQDGTDSSATNDALNGNLTDMQVESNLGSEPIQNVSGFGQDIDDNTPDVPDGDDPNSDMNGTLQAINSSLGSILGVQNEQLAAIRNQSIGASADRINSISTNNETNDNTTSSNTSNLSQSSNFVSELQSLETTIRTINTNVAAGNSNTSTQNNSSTQNSSNSRNSTSSHDNTNLNVENSFEVPTGEAGDSDFGQTFSLLNPRDREFLNYVSNFSNAQGGSTNVTSSSSTSNQTLSVNNNALNNTLQEIRDGDMTIDRTEIQNRVDQTSGGNNSETNVQGSSIFTAFSTALAQHDQNLVQTITNVNNSGAQGQDKGVQLTSSQNETAVTRDVQKGSHAAVASNGEVLGLLSQISMQLLQLNATMNAATRKTAFT